MRQRTHSAGAEARIWRPSQYRRLTARRGRKKAAVALGHAIRIIVYHLLSRAEVYEDLGVNYFDENRRERVGHGLGQRLKDRRSPARAS